MNRAKLLLLLAFTLVLSSFLAACGTADDDAGQGGDAPKEDVAQILNILETAEIPTMDTVMGTDAVAFNVANQVFEGLYRLDENNEATEGMAIDHTLSEDGTVYTFNLRQDATWSNGDPVTANDFVFAWRRAVDPATGSEYGPYMMSGVVVNATQVAEGQLPPDQLGIKAIDDHTLEVTLERPVPYFDSLMTFPTFYPQNEKFVTEQGDQYALEAANMVYNGPFTLSSWEHEVGWTMTKNPDYWDADVVSLETINVKVVKDPATSANLYDTNAVDISGALSSDFVDKYKTHEDFINYGNAVTFYFKFNQTRNPALANVDVRKAISMAVDEQGITDVILNNGSIPANGLVPRNFVIHPETKEDFREHGDFNAYNVEEAKKHWQQALDTLGVSEVTIEVLGGDTETSIKMQDFIKNQLETNLEGLTIKLKNVPFAQRLDLDTAMDYDVQFAGWGPDYLDAMSFMDLWVTDGGNNKMGYSNPEYDRLIKEAKTTLATDPVARFEAMQEAERILLEEDAAIGPLYQRGTAQLMQEYVKNVYIHPFGPDYSYKWTKIEK
ncbi:peptide ABC transporter substrate-binding protein [Bacillus luteolus]|uniref:Peptide ABC transporter substrate-binding protein n=1 Tax=Litchfieldia luteola TaxID=682179 RepID=A0ABR9QLU3_9BACI|nr:peptide ABC transporter substrate-binding protein [Cytobacillus luteolus]MBE4909376.1 peptide ABC transporter substrate-binding protein [Cytobacillus luteolus]MBP1940774.1 oligopeptide transport system substrate-binding protein [Cytobacillus luteolus]